MHPVPVCHGMIAEHSSLDLGQTIVNVSSIFGIYRRKSSLFRLTLPVNTFRLLAALFVKENAAVKVFLDL